MGAVERSQITAHRVPAIELAPHLRDPGEVAPVCEGPACVIGLHTQPAPLERALELFARQQRGCDRCDEGHVAVAGLALGPEHVQATVLKPPPRAEELVRPHPGTAHGPPGAANLAVKRLADCDRLSRTLGLPFALPRLSQAAHCRALGVESMLGRASPQAAQAPACERGPAARRFDLQEHELRLRVARRALVAGHARRTRSPSVHEGCAASVADDRAAHAPRPDRRTSGDSPRARFVGWPRCRPTG